MKIRKKSLGRVLVAGTAAIMTVVGTGSAAFAHANPFTGVDDTLAAVYDELHAEGAVCEALHADAGAVFPRHECHDQS